MALVRKGLTKLESDQRIIDGASMSRLRVYNATVTPSLNPANFVKDRLNRQQRSLISKLRSGTLPIVVETGRYTNIPENLRLCRSCNCNSIENELHFVFQCDRYNDIREQHQTTNIGIPDNQLDHLKYIFCDYSRTKSLANYI